MTTPFHQPLSRREGLRGEAGGGGLGLQAEAAADLRVGGGVARDQGAEPESRRRLSAA